MSNNCFLWCLSAWEFKIEFKALAEEFESIETFPGFVQLLGENWVKSHKKYNNQDHIGKNLSNDKSLEVNVAISQKKIELQDF